MKTPHTPSPWHIEKHNKVVWQDSGGPGNQTYATSCPITLIVHEQLGDPRLRTCVAQLDNCSESESNARLIAAAPELLEACKTILLNLDPSGDHPKSQHVLYSDCLGPENDDQTIVEYLKGVISKAEGNA